MNILLEFSTHNFQTYHSAAKRLKELFPQGRFAGLVGISPGSERVYEFLKSQTEISYEFLVLRHELTKQAMKDDIDHELLRMFEDNLPHKSLWRLVSADRQWGHAFVHGAYTKKTRITQNATRENILRTFCGSYKRLSKIFDDFETELFLPAMCMGSIDVYILEEICRERELPYVVANTCRVKDYYSFSNDVTLILPQLDKTYRQILDGERTVDLEPAQKLYEEITEEKGKVANFDQTHFTHAMVQNETVSLPKMLKLCARAAAGAVREWIRMTHLNLSDDLRGQPYRFSVFWDNLRLAVGMSYQKFLFMRPGVGVRPEPGEKYIYYPLHVNPEYSTNFQGTLWMNQLYNIELLSKSIPHDWTVCVKEHPAMFIARVRPKAFYNKIKEFPNVRMVPVSMTGKELIQGAQMVAVVTGTTGWEAILQGKPVMAFVDNYYDVLGLSAKISSIRTFSLEIRDEIKRNASISPQERKRRIVCYLAAVMEHGFTPSYPLPFCNEPGTPEEYKVCGLELADALISYLDQIGYLDRFRDGMTLENQNYNGK
ncbi:MAG: hypothetical protein KA403_02530 [Candidatus Omnitrophica bacterium]|nr:hypothetical protein [Candidatus Omnitrophota bacterium]